MQDARLLERALDSVRALRYPTLAAVVVLHSPEHPLITPVLRSRFATVVFESPDDADATLPLHQVAWNRWLGEAQPRPLLLLLGTEARLAPDALEHLVCAQQRSPTARVLSPLLREHELSRTRYVLWANVWGAITANDEFAYSSDYVDLVESRAPGVYGVAHTTTAAQLIHPSLLDYMPVKSRRSVFVSRQRIWPELAFSSHLRERIATVPHVDTTPGLGYAGAHAVVMRRVLQSHAH